MTAELRRILNDRGVFGLIVLAPILYGILYPQPYLGQLLREIPIAVVDQDHTEAQPRSCPDLERRRGDHGRGSRRYARRRPCGAGATARCSGSSTFRRTPNERC